MRDLNVVTLNGDAARLSQAAVESFESGLRGQLLQPGCTGYDEARQVWNAMIDRRPALIARCAGTADVIQCVRFAREHDLLVSVRGGGHNVAGTAVCDRGLMIDLSPMKGIRIDPAKRSGSGDAGRFLRSCIEIGVPPSAVERAVPKGPLASLNAADSWVDHPYRSGIALIGDAAASSDPARGLGLSFTARDVRVLRDRLLSQADWESAGHGYAAEHHRYYGAFRAWYNWRRELDAPRGPAADAWRAMVGDLGRQEPDRVPDVVFSGPDVPMDDAAKRRFFGEDIPEIAAARKAALAAC